MAATWERLATERSELIQRHPDLALTGEHAEETATGKPSST
jgi:2-oxo-4-hydroxy-4-carboxy--5-ureidoimidazoline (OHCU) decarboxylase